MLDISQFKFSETPHPMWMAKIENSDAEIYILGDATGVDMVRFELAQKTMPHFERLEASAKKHLHEFFIDDGLENWDTQWIEFGKNACDPTDQFAIYLHQGVKDTYGIYHVTFRLQDYPSKDYFSPMESGREYW